MQYIDPYICNIGAIYMSNQHFVHLKLNTIFCVSYISMKPEKNKTIIKRKGMEVGNRSEEEKAEKKVRHQVEGSV